MKLRKNAILATSLITFGTLIGGAKAAITVNLTETSDGIWSVSSLGGGIDFDALFTSINDISFQIPANNNASLHAILRPAVAFATHSRPLTIVGGGTITADTFIHYTGFFGIGVAGFVGPWVSTNDFSTGPVNVTGANESVYFASSPTVDDSVTYTYSANTTDTFTVNVDVLESSAVPEPSSTFFLGGSALGLLVRRKRAN